MTLCHWATIGDILTQMSSKFWRWQNGQLSSKSFILCRHSEKCPPKAFPSAAKNDKCPPKVLPLPPKSLRTCVSNFQRSSQFASSTGLCQLFQPISLIYRVVQNISTNLPQLHGCAKHFSHYLPSTGFYHTFQPISIIYRVVPNILANLPHLQGCTKHSSQFAPSTGMCQTFQPISLIYRAVT